MRQLVLLACFFALFFTAGCDDERKPMPSITIIVMAEADQFLLNQQRMNQAALETELKRLADDNRRPMTGHVRAHVFVDTERGVDYYRTQEIVNICANMGFVNVVSNSTGMK